MEPAFQTSRIRADQTDELPLFVAVDPAPLVVTSVASNPQSEASADAADMLSPDSRANQQRAVIACLAKLPDGAVVSRVELSRRVGIDLEVICWRLAELKPQFVEEVKRACRSHKKPNLKVSGFRLTDAGRARVRTVQP